MVIAPSLYNHSTADYFKTFKAKTDKVYWFYSHCGTGIKAQNELLNWTKRKL